MLVFTTFIYWAEYKHGNNINWIHSQSLLDLFALLYGLVGWKIPENGKFQRCQDGWEGTKIGKGTKVSSRLNFPWIDDQRLSQYIKWTAADFVTIFSSILTIRDINLEMERWQIHIYTWYIDIFTSAIWTRWSIEYQISLFQDFAWL